VINSDTASRLKDEVLSAFALLTRLPLPQPATFRGAAGAWSWPLVGLAVSALSACGAGLALWLGAPAGVAAATALAVSALVTGALHEDGLSDTFDGLFGGWTKERRLEIMKDSRVGSYGVLALLLVTLARWSALVALIGAGHWMAVLAAGAMSRAPMGVLMAFLRNARGSGLSHGTGAPSRSIALAGVGLALALGLVLTGAGAFAATLALLAVTVALGWVAKRKIGGQTGDILGASQQIAEAVVLAVLVA
jgi:adenosylcobinamide-GDP ribazoletransferase